MAVGAMFGAPVGISAAEDQINQNQQATLTAVETLGKIAKQPADLALVQANTRLHAAQADEHEVQAAANRQFITLSQQAAAEGRLVTVDDVPDGKPQSVAAPLEKLYSLARGLPLAMQTKLATTIASIKQKEASALNNDSRVAQRNLAVQEAQAQRIAQLSQAALDNPESYDLLRAQAVSEGLPISKLPEAFDAKLLTTFRDAGIKAIDKIREQRKADEAASTDALHRSSMARNQAEIALAGEKTALTKTRNDQLAKNGGRNTQIALDSKEALNKRREIANQKDLDKMYPPAPLDPTKRQEGTKYRTATGVPFIWGKDPATGKMVAMQITVAPPIAKALQQRVAKAGGADDTPDDGDDNEDDE